MPVLPEKSVPRQHALLTSKLLFVHTFVDDQYPLDAADVNKKITVRSPGPTNPNTGDALVFPSNYSLRLPDPNTLQLGDRVVVEKIYDATGMREIPLVVLPLGELVRGRLEAVVLRDPNSDPDNPEYSWAAISNSSLADGSSAGSPGGAARDPLAVGDNLDLMAAVMRASWTDGDLLSYASSADQDVAAPPAVSGQDSSILVGSADVATADEFDGKDSTGSAWRFRYGRRNDGTSGWTRIPKG